MWNVIINPILIWIYLRKWGWPDLPHFGISPTPTLHLAGFMTSFFSKPTLLLSFSTCIFHAFFGHPHFFLPFTSNSNTFHKTCPSSLLNTCPYHLTPFAFAIWTTVFFNPNFLIRSSVLVFFISFAPHIALTNVWVEYWLCGWLTL